jgi:16S rRNA (guanine966-N2)-methyltransferase
MLANEIRIIGGQWRGRKLRFPGIAGVRPTPDRVRETLFNWLGQDLTGRRTLDAFAGSGALSFEALSRGAALAVATDRERKLVEAMTATAAKLGCASLEAHCVDAIAFLSREKRSFDVVFLDPPFDSPGWDRLLPLAVARLAPGGTVYIEAAAEIEPPPGFTLWRRDRAGKVHYHLLRHSDHD